MSRDAVQVDRDVETLMQAIARLEDAKRIADDRDLELRRRLTELEDRVAMLESERARR